MSKDILVSKNANYVLGELLWLGTSVEVIHPNDGVFKSMGRYFLWLKTLQYPIVRALAYETGLETLMLREPSVNLTFIAPDDENRLRIALHYLLVNRNLLNSFIDPENNFVFDMSTPACYQQFLLKSRSLFASN